VILGILGQGNGALILSRDNRCTKARILIWVDLLKEPL
jgi:hypothetical protein